MKKTTFTLLLSLSCCWLAAQCPTGDIIFSSQGQIDSFTILYPGCTDIPESVKISGNDITTLQGLSVLDSIKGCLRIEGNPVLVSLNGLENLIYVGTCETSSIPGKGGTASLSIRFNTMLTSLSGLDHLKSLGACLTIEENPALVAMNGLDSLSEVGLCWYHGGEWDFPLHSIGVIGNKSLKTIGGLANLDSLEILTIFRNDSLVSLNGLGNLRIIGNFSVSENAGMSDFNGLERLKIVGSFDIAGNQALTNLNGLENLQSISYHLDISDNDALTSLNGLENLQVIGGEISINNNDTLTSLTGLENLQSIGENLRINTNQALTSLNGLENLKVIGGGFEVGYNDALTSLGALANLQSLGGPLGIHYNDVLTSLSGLENLQFIGGELGISYNKTLSSLTGLNNINSIGGDLLIYSNNALQSLNGLEKLKSLWTAPGFKTNLEISYNPKLESLTGLDSLKFTTIGKLKLYANPKLSVCNIPPVCAYLQTPAPRTIDSNAPGCNSVPEIEAACTVPTGEAFSDNSPLLVSPNPAGDFLQIQIGDTEKWEISLFDLRGRLLYRQTVSGSQTIEVGTWPVGLYMLRAVSGERAYAGRFVKW